MNSKEAEENLRVIRSLMEKATIYRAISAPTALVGGLASAFGGLSLYAASRLLRAGPEDERFEMPFIIGWGAVLALTAAANTLLLWRDARRRGDRFVSGGMKHALLAMLPAILCGAGLTVFHLLTKHPFWLPPMWMLCYALGLLATKGFAPRSIHFLGWAFLAAGFGTLAVLANLGMQAGWDASGTQIATAANLLMAATFGLFHLVYAAFTWPRGAGKAN